ncbi:MAG: hypothetical protein JXA69_09630 [Phycisphaerae bacterium]|nr:hypothetical protein [Phycisphaerae bacterium]
MRSHTRIIWWLAVLVAWLGAAGCGPDPKDRFGRTYYIDGAGNWGFGVAEMTYGLADAGYQGCIRNWRWSPTFNPALDQTIGRPVARASGANLGREITAYRREHPDMQVNIIALSAGTGVAVWACEAVVPPASVHNVVLLGSSLSSKYDVRRALSHIDGQIFVYVSPHDQILLGPVQALGTIDGTSDTAAGLAGLRVPKELQDRVVNIRWSRKYEKYGWTGAHTDCTSEPFVRHVLAQHIVSRPGEAPEVLQPAFVPVDGAMTAADLWIAAPESGEALSLD